MKYKLLILNVFIVILSCKSQEENNISFQEIDINLSETYKKFSDNRHDYGENARDTILNRFKNNLLKVLSNEKSAEFSFDSLVNIIKSVTSKDKKLRIFSWDELNGGSWHIYNSAYQYNETNKSFSGLLSLENDTIPSSLSTDITHYQIEDIQPNKYLVKGYGTHGSGEEFFVYRLLNFSDGKIVDCSKCFNGKDRLVFTRSRSAKLELNYNSESKEITYPEMIPSVHEGEETGFTKPSGKTLKLKYKNGVFVKSNN